MKYLKAVVLVMILCIALFTLTGCKKKDAITDSEFREKMESKGFELQDATNQFPDGSIESVTIALKDGYQIEFYVAATEEQAISAYNENKSDFENRKSSGAVQTRNEVSNHGKFTVSSNGKYMVISRIGNTFIYVDVSDEYRAEVKKVLDELGY